MAHSDNVLTPEPITSGEQFGISGVMVEVPIGDVLKAVGDAGYLVFPSDVLQKYAQERQEAIDRQNTCEYDHDVMSKHMAFDFCYKCGKKLR